MTAAPPPNWYPDPHDPAQLRWWDGAQWTEHRHALPGTAVPAATAPSATATDQWSASASAPANEAAAVAPRAASETFPPINQPIEAQATRQPFEPSSTSWGTPPLVRPAALPPPGPRLPKQNRTAVIVGVAVIAALVIGALVFALTRGGDGNKVVLEAPATTAASATSVATTAPSTTTVTSTTRAPATSVATTSAAALAGTTFTDPTNVYRIRVAPTWQETTVVGGLQTWATGTGSSIFRDSVNVLVEKLPIDVTMDDYLAASVKNAPKSLPSFVEVSRSVNTVNGKIIGQLDFTSNQNAPLRHRAVVLIKGRNAIVVTYTAEPGRFDTESAKVQPYLTSVEGV